MGCRRPERAADSVTGRRRLIVFDLDGTIIDSTASMRRSFHAAATRAVPGTVLEAMIRAPAAGRRTPSPATGGRTS